VENWAKTKKGG